MNFDDTGWLRYKQTTNTRYYKRVITFQEPQSEEQIELIRGNLQRDPACPGWTGVKVTPVDNTPTTYQFTTEYNSGD